MDSSGHSIFGSYLGLVFLISLPSAILAFYINSRKKVSKVYMHRLYLPCL